MIKKSLSNSPQQQVHEPSSTFTQLTPSEHGTLDVLLEAACDFDIIEFAQETIAKKTGYVLRTISRAAQKLEEIGLIKKTYRHLQSCIYEVNPILYTDPDWHNELYHWFRRYPAFVRKVIKTIPLALSLIFSPAAAKQEKCRTSISGEKSPVYLSNQRHTTVEYPKGQRGVPLQMPLVTKIKKDGKCMEQVNPAKTHRVRGIALALNKRGAKLSNYDAIGIMAYDDAVLDAAVAKMKESTGVRNPAAFFLGVCKKTTAELGLVPDWDTPRYLRTNLVRLLTPDEETAALQVAVPVDAPRRTQKQDGDGLSYTEQVRQGQAREKEAAEFRKPAHLKAERTVLAVEAELAGWRESLAQQEAKVGHIALWPTMRKMADVNIAWLEQELRDLARKPVEEL